MCTFLANSFDVWIVRGIAIIDVTTIVRVIVVMGTSLEKAIWEMKFAAPVRDFEIRATVRNEVAITRVFMDPSKIKNCSFEIFPRMRDPRTAAWLAPSPGKSEQIGETIIVDIVGLTSSFFGREIFSRNCFGIVVFLFIETIRLEDAKRPVRSGSNGSWRFELRVAIPRNPESKKIIAEVAKSPLSFSSYNKKTVINSRKNPSIFCIKGYAVSRKR